MPASSVLRRGRSDRVLPPAVSGQEVILVVVIALLWVILGATTPAFLSAESIQALLWAVAPLGVMAVGMTMVIVTAGIDISIAAMMMTCAVVLGKLITSGGVGFLAAIPLIMLLGGAMGALNGLLIAYGRVPAMIITFGTANLFQFLGLRIFNSQTVNGLPPSRDILGPSAGGRVAGVPLAFLIMLLLVAAAWFYMRHFPGGRHYYAIGDDPAAAELAGVNVRARSMSAYVITGLMVGLASCMSVAGGTSTLDQSVGSGQELATIAAVVIGGTSILGGRGSVLGAVLGALLVQTVMAGVTQLGWPSQLSQLFVGVMIILTVGADLVRESRNRRQR